MAARKRETSAPGGSKRARQITAVVIEAFSGELGTTEAAERLGVSLSRYYQLEARALEGMMAALEPRPRGKAKTPAREIATLKAEKKALEKELRRQQALLRAAHRAVGLPSRGPKGASSKGRGRRQRGSRGQTVLQTLRREPDASEGGGDGTAQQHGESGVGDAGESAGA